MIITRIRTSTRSVLNHPFIVIAFLFVAFLYKLSPFLFSLLLSVSPVLVCTVVLLGTLLTFADPQLPEIENVSIERSIRLQNHTVSFSKVDEYSSREIVVTNRNHEESVDDHFESSSMTWTRMKDDENEDEDEDKVDEYSSREIVVTNRNHEESVDDHFECSSMPWTRMNDDENEDEDEDSGSDGDESSSIEPSMADIIPLLDEIDPLIECENSDLLSRRSHDSNEETDHQEAEDEEENQENKEEEEKSEIVWTEDDQKNLMDLGSSELERNQRLESLIARRRARRNMKMMKEKNLIDLDGFDLPYQVPNISTARLNPFEFPNVTYDDMGLPPIPGSAPSILLPRRNPFDLPYDSSEEKPDLSGDGFQQEFMELNHKDPVFRRHESFNIGSSIFEYPRKDRLEATRGSRFRPYFVADRLVDDGFMRQSSEISDSSSFQRQESGVSDESSSYRRQSSDVSESKGSEGVMLSSEMDLGSVHDDQYGKSDFDLHLPEIQLGESETRVSGNDPNIDTWMFEDRNVGEEEDDDQLEMLFDQDSNVMLQTIEEEHISSSSSSSVVSEDHNDTESVKHDEVLDNDSDVPTEQDPVYDSSPRGSKIHVSVSSEDMLEEFVEPELFNEDALVSEESGLYTENLVDVPRNVEEKVNSVEDEACPLKDDQIETSYVENTEKIEDMLEEFVEPELNKDDQENIEKVIGFEVVEADSSNVENAEKSGHDGSLINKNVEIAEADPKELTNSHVSESKARLSNLEVEVEDSIEQSNDEKPEIFETIESHEIPDKVLKIEEIELSLTKK